MKNKSVQVSSKTNQHPWATWQQGRGKPKGRERVEFCLNSFHFVSFFSLSPQAISVAKEIVAIHTVFSYNRVRNPSNRTPRRGNKSSGAVSHPHRSLHTDLSTPISPQSLHTDFSRSLHTDLSSITPHRSLPITPHRSLLETNPGFLIRPAGNSKRKETCSQASSSSVGDHEVRPEGIKAAKAKKKNSAPLRSLSECQTVWEMKKEDLLMRKEDLLIKERLTKLVILDTLLAKKDPLTEPEEATKNKLLALI
ncbi:hypothetical protein YC2023_048681 [Brassica napus]